MSWYNWFSPAQRNKKGRDRLKRIKNGETFPTHGQCTLCGDPDVDIEPHSEDYSEPFAWSEPAVYYLCVACHKSHLHKRFNSKNSWLTHLAHVRRGGYSSDRKSSEIVAELTAYKAALDRSEIPTPLKGLGRMRHFVDSPWWECLTMDRSSIEGPNHRARHDSDYSA